MYCENLLVYTLSRTTQINAVARATVHALCTRPTTGAHLGFTLALTHVEFKQIAA